MTPDYDAIAKSIHTRNNAPAAIATALRAAHRSGADEALGMGSNPALLAILRDCRTSIGTALKAAEIEATPGPGWRATAAGLLKLIDDVTKRGAR